jgi:uncharacterized protein YecA (UPF0149 family)
MEMTQGLQKVRKLPNGRIDFLSVNESARLHANMQNQFDNDSFKELMKGTMAQDNAENTQVGRVEKHTQQTSKVGRNDPCPCGSGRKYKKCCGK